MCLGGALVRYVSLGVCTGWMRKYTYARVYEEPRERDRPESGTECLPRSLPLTLSRQGLSMNLMLSFQLGWLDRGLQGSFCLCCMLPLGVLSPLFTQQYRKRGHSFQVSISWSAFCLSLLMIVAN